MRVIDGDALLAEYDRVHVGPPGGARKLIEDAPTITPNPDDGWILCSEKMPEESDSMFAKFYGTDRWKDGMFRKRSKFVEVTVVRRDGKREVALAKTYDGEWGLGLNYYPNPPKVIAWKPRVEPYMGEEKT